MIRLTIFLLGLLLLGCKKEPEEPRWNVNTLLEQQQHGGLIIKYADGYSAKLEYTDSIKEVCVWFYHLKLCQNYFKRTRFEQVFGFCRKRLNNGERMHIYRGDLMHPTESEDFSYQVEIMLQPRSENQCTAKIRIVKIPYRTN